MKIEEMSRVELANYCANLLSIMSSKEDAGVARGQTIATEYTTAYDRMVRIIKGEEDEARDRPNYGQRTETGTDLPRSEPSIRRTVGEPRGSGEGSGDYVPGAGDRSSKG